MAQVWMGPPPDLRVLGCAAHHKGQLKKTDEMSLKIMDAVTKRDKKKLATNYSRDTWYKGLSKDTLSKGHKVRKPFKMIISHIF
jgi:hypothetical protein